MSFNPLKYSICFDKPRRLTDVCSWHEHIPFAFAIVQLLKPKVIIELGTHKGDSYCAFCQAVDVLKLDTACYAVDTWEGDDHSGLYGIEVLEDLRAYHDPLYGRFSRLIQSQFDTALKYFPDGSVDLLHIDGLHSYEAVKHDFENWLQKMNRNGIVLIHDTNVREREFGVWLLWRELKDKYPSFEFKHGHGLGVLAVGENVPAEVLDLMDVADQNPAVISNFFSYLGNNILLQYKVHEQNTRISEFIKSVEAKDKWIVELNSQIIELNSQIIELNKTIKAKDIATLAKVNELNEIIKSRDAIIVALNNDLNSLKNSVSFRLINSITSSIDKVFPDDSYRGYLKNKVVNSFRIIMNQGFQSFLRAIKEKIRNRGHKMVESSQSTFLQLNDIDISNIINDIERLDYKPKISILMPVYNSESSWLRTAINSLKIQLYSNWELCICDDGSTKPEPKEILQEYLKIDKRIKVTFSEINEGISKATNKALELATGEFIVLLDHDDELTKNALYEIVKAINNNRDISFIYSDEDKISEDGNYIEPFYKPDFSMELLRSMNYLIHLAAFKKILIELVGGFDKEFDGAQDFDLFFRMLEKTDKVYHIRKILYHWRKSEVSGAKDALAKPWIYEKGKLAIENHLKRSGIEATVKIGYGWGLYKVDYKINRESIIDIIIPTRKISWFKKCIHSIRKNTTYQNYNLWAVINGKSDYEVIQIKSHTGEELDTFTDKEGLIGYELPYNWSRMNNIAVSFTKEHYIIFINDDIEIITKDWIENMLQYSQFDHIGAVGVMLLYKDNRIQHAGDFILETGTGDHCFNGMAFNSFEIYGFAQVVRECSAVTSACMMVRRDVFNKMGGFDETLRNFDDYDFCLRLREAGYSIIYTPYARAFHHESPTRPQVLDDQMLNYMLKKHEIKGFDPFYRYEWRNLYKKKT